MPNESSACNTDGSIAIKRLSKTVREIVDVSGRETTSSARQHRDSG
jgi:hypothetical protein